MERSRQSSKGIEVTLVVNAENPYQMRPRRVTLMSLLGYVWYLSLQSIEPLHVAEYLGNLSLSTPSVKLQVAAIRRLFGYLVNYGEMSINLAANVKTARQSISTGKTQVMEAADVRVLFESMGDGKLVTLRDRALIGTMVYTFARVSAVVKMRVEDYLTVGKRSLLRLHEKGGKEHQVPVHLVLEGYLDGYLAKAELGKKDWLFPSAVASSDRLSGKQMARENVMHMVKRRTERAGLGDVFGCHTFRATGITAFLKAGGTLEKAQQIAGHASSSTTKLYDRTNDEVSLEEIQRIRF